jgi:hypothetical protein
MPKMQKNVSFVMGAAIVATKKASMGCVNVLANAKKKLMKDTAKIAVPAATPQQLISQICAIVAANALNAPATANALD